MSFKKHILVRAREISIIVVLLAGEVYSTDSLATSLLIQSAVRTTIAGASYQRSEVIPEHVPVGCPTMAANPISKRFSSRLYSAFVRSEQRSDVLLRSSDDGGATWSEPSSDTIGGV